MVRCGRRPAQSPVRGALTVGPRSYESRQNPLDTPLPRLAGLVCPICHGELGEAGGRPRCRLCRREFPVVDGSVDLRVMEEVGPYQREVIERWDASSASYRSVVAAIPPGRLRAIDRPLLRIARGHVVELGCGDGRLLEQLRGPGVATRLGVDWSPRMVAAARAGGHAAVLARAERLPLPSASADTVVSGAQGLRDARWDATLAEVARVLRPGGRFGFALLGRRAVDLAARAAALRALAAPADRRAAARVLLGLDAWAVSPNDVVGLAALRAGARRRGLAVRAVLGVPWVPLLGRVLLGTAGGLPYLTGSAAVRFGFDVLVLGERARAP